jgi:hypothetical protein
MALVAATAIGLGLARGMRDELWSQTNMSVAVGSVGAILLAVARWMVLGLPLVMAWTVALLLLGLRRPRPRLGDRIHRPGTTACGAATLAMALGAANLTALMAVVRASVTITQKDNWIVECMVEGLLQGIGIDVSMPGVAVTVAWATLALGGHWKPAQHWLERVGRLLGVVWIAFMVVAPWISASLHGVWS